MLALAKRLVGADRGAAADDDAVHAATNRLEAAKLAHAEEVTRVQGALARVAEAQAAFDANPTNRHADAVIDTRRAHEKAELFAQRTQRAVAEAEGELRAAEIARDERELAALTAEVDAKTSSAEAIANRYAPRILEAAIAAGREALELRARIQIAQRRKNELATKLGRHVPHPDGLEHLNSIDPRMILQGRLLHLLIHHPDDGRKFAGWLEGL